MLSMFGTTHSSVQVGRPARCLCVFACAYVCVCLCAHALALYFFFLRYVKMQV